MRSYEATPSKTCQEGYTEGMSAEEVSSLMQIPLVRFNWLPNDIAEIAPQVEPYGLPHFDDSGGMTCVIRISYPDFLPTFYLRRKNKVQPGLTAMSIRI
jgi:hypothetical protein